MVQLDNGLDEQGYIRNVYSPSNIQAEFKSAVDAVVNELTTKLPHQIDSIYLYGSIGRGNAVLGKSDLDLSIILKHPQNDAQRQVFEGMARHFPNRYPEISKIDLDIGHVDEVMFEHEYYRWQFWLKHCCCCIWGNDLSYQFDWQKPSIHLAAALNGDIGTYFEQVIPKLSIKSDTELVKMIGKKLLRTAYTLIAAADSSWHTDMTQCYEACCRNYEDKDQIHIATAYQMAMGNASTIEEALLLLEQFGGRLALALDQAISHLGNGSSSVSQ